MYSLRNQLVKMSKKRTILPIQSLVPAPATPVKFINGSDSGPFRIKLHVKPGTKMTQIIDYSDDCVGVQVRDGVQSGTLF